MTIARRRSGSPGLRHGLARLLSLLVLVLVAAGGLQPAMGCATGSDAQAGSLHVQASAGPHGGSGAMGDHGRHAHAGAVGSESAPAARADASVHGHTADASHGSMGSCCHLNCPVCLARLPTAPEPLRRTAEARPLRLHLALLPAGIVPAPPRAPPRSA